jgi:putative redox protein
MFEMEIVFSGNKKVDAIFNGKVVKTDQPIQAGGDGTAPAPFDLFLASIGTCAGIYVLGFCQARGIPTDGIKLIQKMNYNFQERLFDKIEIEIKLPPNFPEKYKTAVLNAADNCAVKKHLQNPPEIIVKTI